MHKNNIPLKVALGYSAIAIIMILAISLVYSNTKSINAINEASREYIQKRSAADSTISSLLKEEQRNLKQLSDAMAGRPTQNYLQNKVKNLNTGKDSILVHSKAPQTHEAKKTTVEVLKTRRGFFRRLADAFKKEHAETLSVKQDSNRAVIDSVTTPVNVAENVATILEQIDKKEKVATQDHKQSINKEMEDLKMVSAKLALRSAKHLSDVHQREKDNMQEAIKKAMEARKHLLWQMELLAIVAFFAIVIMIWFIWRDARKERIYRENLELIGTDPATDVALIKIEEHGLPVIPLADSDKLRLGEWVIAIGSPYDLRSTITAGIVSAKGRTMPNYSGEFKIESFIQTDAAVNPGNSGGALVNKEGQLVGVNTAIISQTGSYAGYSFAVPSNIVKRITDDLMDYGTVHRAMLGISMAPVDEEIARNLKLSSVNGVYIADVVKGSAAENAGLKVGDVLVEIGNVKITGSASVQEAVNSFHPGEKTAVKVIRDGSELSFDVVFK